jgi:taurine dioxygenase
MLSVKKLPGRFGAEIEGLDLRQPLNRETAKALIDVFHANRIVAIRGQALAFEDFDRVTREFGDQKPHFLDHLRMDGHPAILMLSNIHEHGRPIGVYEGAAFWHTDVAYQDPPNSATVVYSIRKPAGGCPTYFADQVAAYEALPEKMKAFIDDKVVLHHYGNRADMDENSPRSAERLTPEQKKNVTNVYMPLVRHHHVTGTKALYGVAGSSFGIVGMPDDEATGLLDELAAHATSEEFTTSYDYEVGDLAAWDTFQTLHMATLQQPATDDSDSRILWRVSVTGKPPVYRG